MPPSRASVALARRAVELDSAGDAVGAASAYEDAARSLEGDASTSASDEDARSILLKAKEYLARARELSSARSSAVASTSRGREEAPSTRKSSSSSAMAGAAAVGACAGFALLGPVSAVVAAGAMAYGTPRRDAFATAARGAGRAAVTTVTSPPQWNNDYKITEKAAAAVSSAAKAASDFDREREVTKTVGRGVGVALSAASEFDRRHEVTKTIGRGVGVALSAGLDAARDVTSSASSNRASPPGDDVAR